MTFLQYGENQPVKIPGFSNYTLTRKGEVFSYLTEQILQGSVNPDGYLNFRLLSDEGKTTTVGLHRLLGLTFLDIPENVDDYVINHIDGIKSNNDLENLEWVTDKENLEHAGKLGLTSKCKPISTRDVDSGEIEEFPSYIECARKFGLTKDAVVHRLKSDPSRVFPEGKQYKHSNDGVDWDKIVIPRGRRLFGRARPVLCLDLLTKQETAFSSARQLAEYLDMSEASVCKWLKMENHPVIPGLYQVRHDDGKNWRKVKDYYLELESNTSSRCVVTIDPDGKNVKVFESAKKCSEWVGITPTNLDHRLKSNFGRVFPDGKRYGYYSDFVLGPPSQQ